MDLSDLSACGSPAPATRPQSAQDLGQGHSFLHSWRCDEAVTSVVAAGKHLFAGTISGLIHIYDLETYEHLHEIQAHSGSVLVLLVREGMLFSGSSDSLVKVWELDTKSYPFEPVLRYTVYSVFDVGDIFSIEYVPELRCLYFGTQSASISWVKLPSYSVGSTDSKYTRLSTEHRQRRPSHHHHPAVRPNKFFDSAGPGGRLAPPQHQTKELISHIDADSTLIEAPVSNSISFAHNGYVYAMLATKLHCSDGPFLLASGSGDGFLKIWTISDVSGIQETHTYDAGEPVLSMALVNDWQLYCGLGSGDTLVIDLETFQTLKYKVAPGQPLLTVTCIGDSLIATSGNRILEYDPASSSLNSWTASDEITTTTSLDLKKHHLVTATRDGVVSLWKVSSNNDDTSPSYGAEDDLSWKGVKNNITDHDVLINVLDRLIQYQTVSGKHRRKPDSVGRALTTDTQNIPGWSESRRCASAFRDLLRIFGAESELLRVEYGNPIVYAKFSANKKSHDSKLARVLFYGHYDVIEANSECWDTPPFQITAKDGYLYGRGVSDNKGPCVAAIFAVATLYAEQKLTNDVVFLIEGEEEAGSFGFYQTVENFKHKIGNIDWIIFSNSYWINDTTPCLNYGLRGVIFLQVRIHNDKSDVHSGVDGGSFREPALDMINLLSRLTKDSGEISIPGFADSVLPVTEHEDSLYEEITRTEGIRTTKEALMCKWRYPSLTVHKMEVSGPGNQTVIPSSVVASISVRLVPNQTTVEIKQKLLDFINASFDVLKSPNRLTVDFRYDADPWLGDPRNAAFQILKESVKEEWGVDPLFVREGGTIPMARALEKMFDAPAAQIPVGQSSDNAHLNNERLRVTNLIGAKRIFSQLFEKLEPRN